MGRGEERGAKAEAAATQAAKMALLNMISLNRVRFHTPAQSWHPHSFVCSREKPIKVFPALAAFVRPSIDGSGKRVAHLFGVESRTAKPSTNGGLSSAGVAFVHAPGPCRPMSMSIVLCANPLSNCSDPAVSPSLLRTRVVRPASERNALRRDSEVGKRPCQASGRCYGGGQRVGV